MCLTVKPLQLIPLGILLALMCVAAQIQAAEPLIQIVSTSPSWQGFTQKDGTGLYHEILNTIFSSQKITVTHKYSNAKRGIYLVQKGMADLYVCKTDLKGQSGLILARSPMYEGRFYAIFKKETVSNWDGMKSLEHQRVIWRRGYYTPDEFTVSFKILETDSGTAALDQVLLDRGDFYIDDLNLIKESLAQSRMDFDPKTLAIQPVGKRRYFPVFRDCPRGRKIMALYEAGIQELAQKGRLKEIFEKWHHPYPSYDVHP